MRFSKQDITVSNGISLARIFCLLPFVYFYNAGHIFLAFLVFLIGAATDILDGYIARKTNTISGLGKILDPLADKLCLSTIIIIFYFDHIVPIWLVILLLARDLTIFLAGIYLFKSKGVVPMSLTVGKAAVIVLGIAFCVAMFKNDSLELLRYSLFYLSAALLVASFLQYVSRFFHILKN